jgi:hypothetical protein
LARIQGAEQSTNVRHLPGIRIEQALPGVDAQSLATTPHGLERVYPLGGALLAKEAAVERTWGKRIVKQSGELVIPPGAIQQSL